MTQWLNDSMTQLLNDSMTQLLNDSLVTRHVSLITYHLCYHWVYKSDALRVVLLVQS